MKHNEGHRYKSMKNALECIVVMYSGMAKGTSHAEAMSNKKEK